MPVNQRGSSWQAAVSFKGRRLRKDFPTEAEARAWEATTLADLKSGRVAAQPEKQVPTLLDLLNRAYERRWRGTKGEETAMINARHVVDALGPTRLASSLNRDDPLTLKRVFRERGISDATINRKLAAYSVLLKEAHEDGHIDRLFKVGITKERQGRIRYLTRAEEEQLLSWAESMGEEEFFDYLVVSLDTGFRQGEVLRIRRRDCEGDTLWTYDTKNGKARDVPLSKRAWVALLRRLETTSEDPNACLFGMLPAALRERWRKAQTLMGLAQDDEFVPHIMRHTFVTRLLESGVDIKTVQELAGHENITTTQRYAHTSAERKLLAIQRMQAA